MTIGHSFMWKILFEHTLPKTAIKIYVACGRYSIFEIEISRLSQEMFSLSLFFTLMPLCDDHELMKLLNVDNNSFKDD